MEEVKSSNNEVSEKISGIIRDMGVDFFMNEKNLLIIDSYESKGKLYKTVVNAVGHLTTEPLLKKSIMDSFKRNTFFSSDSDILNLFIGKDLKKGNTSLLNKLLENCRSDKENTNNNMKKIKFDKVIMNPPYDIGGKIWDEIRKVSENIVCLMPLAQYKANERYKYINYFEVVNNTLFDAVITDNLCITICKSGEYHEENTYEKFELFSYDEKFLPFYERNIGRNHYAIDSYSHDSSLPKRTPSNKTDFYVTVRAAKDGVHIDECSYDRMWNINKNISLDSMPKQTDKKSGKIKKYWGGWIQFNTETENSNYCKWHYYKGKRGLAHFLIKGMNKCSGSIKIAMPRIDWQSISDHPFWKEGKYDEAVLDTMGLKWEGDKIVEI